MQVAAQATTTVQTIFDPGVVRQYAEMVPDAPERILRQFELNAQCEREQAEQAIAAQNLALNFQFRDNRRRDWMAFALVIIALGISVGFALRGNVWISGGAFVTLIGYLVWGFLASRKGKK